MPPIRFDYFVGVMFKLAGVDVKASPSSINVVTGASTNLQDDGAGGVTLTISDGSNKQPLDSDLTAIAALTPSNDDVIQRKSGAWTNRTIAQLAADFPIASSLLNGLVSTAAQTFLGLKNFLSGITVGSAAGTIGNIRFFNASNSFTTDLESGVPSGDVIVSMPAASGTLAIASQVQPVDPDLTAIAALTPSNDDFIQRKAGAWTNRTVAQVRADVVDGYSQPLDSDLTAIAALSPANDDIVQRKAGAWTNRTMAQLMQDQGENFGYYLFNDDMDGIYSTTGRVQGDKLHLASGTLNNTYVPAESAGIVVYGQAGAISTGSGLAYFLSHPFNSPTTKVSGYILPIGNMRWRSRIYIPAEALSTNNCRWLAGLFNESNLYIGAYFFGGLSNNQSISCTTNGTTTLTSSAAFLPHQVGKKITGTGIPADTYVVKYNSSSSLTLSQAASDSSTTNRNFTDLGTWCFGQYDSTNGLTFIDTGVTISLSTYYKLEFRSNAAGTTLTPYVNGTGYTPLTLVFTGSVSSAAGGKSISGVPFGLDYITFGFPDLR